MNTIPDMIQYSSLLDEQKHDRTYQAGEMMFVDSGNLSLPSDFLRNAVDIPLTEHAFGQACAKLSIPTDYMRRCPPILQAVNFNYWRDDVGKPWMVREYAGKARAILSEHYSIVNNTFVLESLWTHLGSVPHTLETSYLDENMMHVRVSVASTDINIDGAQDAYKVGVYLGNSEIGTRSLRVSPFIQRGSCTNTTIWVEGGYVQRHYQVSPHFVRGALKEALWRIFNDDQCGEMLRNMLEAEAATIEDPAQAIARLCKQKGYSPEVEQYALMGTEGKSTRAAVVHAFSYAANHVNDHDLSYELQALSGAILQGASIHEQGD